MAVEGIQVTSIAVKKRMATLVYDHAALFAFIARFGPIVRCSDEGREREDAFSLRRAMRGGSANSLFSSEETWTEYI